MSKMKSVLLLGEMLLRLSPENHKMIIQSGTNLLEMFYNESTR